MAFSKSSSQAPAVNSLCKWEVSVSHFCGSCDPLKTENLLLDTCTARSEGGLLPVLSPQIRQ